MNLSCKQLTRKFYIILYKSFEEFLVLHDLQFRPQNKQSYVSNFILSLLNIIAPCIFAFKSVDPVLYKLKKVVAPLRFAAAISCNKLCTDPQGLFI